MTDMQLITLISLLGWGYSAALSVVLLFFLQKERSAIHDLLSTTRFEKREKPFIRPLGDRIGELQKKWRDPLQRDGKEGDSH